MRFINNSTFVLVFVLQLVFAQHVVSQEASDKQNLNSDNAAPGVRIDKFLSASTVNGFSGAVLVAQNGKIVFNKGYGFAEKDNKKPITSKTIFDIGSVTKQFTGAAILKLVERGKLKTSDSLSLYFDDLPDDKKAITIHQLLTHTAGLIDSFGEGDFDHIPEPKFFGILFSAELLSVPGTKHRYSNAGYSALAKIIEKVSGEEYEEFLNKQLFEPAGMQQTGYLLPKWNRAQLAHGYQRNVMARGTTVDRYRDDQKVSWNLKGNGGLNSTQEDMFKWYQAMKSEKILSKSLIKQWTEPYVVEQQDGSSHYAYGWAIFKSKNGSKIVSHNGGNGAFFHEFIWQPKEDVVVILSSNAASDQVESVGWHVRKIVFDESYQPDPIRKNPYFLVNEFIQNRNVTESASLLSLIKGENQNDFQEPEVLNRMGYITLRSEKNLEWAEAIFELNTQLFPDDGNVWDSLGECFQALGKKNQAIAAFRTAVELGNSESASKLKLLLDEKMPKAG